MTDKPVVIIGAGIAGISTAYHLTTRHGWRDVIVIDPRPPLTLTSDKSTECFRNWWPNRSMVELMNRSIDLLEEASLQTGGGINLTRAGYLYVTAEEGKLAEMGEHADRVSELGGGKVRRHPGPVPYGPQDNGVDVLGPAELAKHHGHITPDAAGAIEVRRAGHFSAQQLGQWMLDEARSNGARLLANQVVAIDVDSDQVGAVELDDGDRIATDAVVVAAGPFAKPVAAMAGVDLPLHSEVHVKVAFRDHRQIIKRDAGMFIWADTQRLDWSDQERAALEKMGRTDLTGEMPIHCHGRPEGGAESPWVVGLWEYHRRIIEPVWPLPEDELYPEVVMKGLTTMAPGLGAYLSGLPEHVVDGGYYTKTEENRPLIGPAGPAGLHIVCGLSGFGVMAASGAADLAARHIVGAPLPGYAPDFLLGRYQRPEYMKMISGLVSGQL